MQRNPVHLAGISSAGKLARCFRSESDPRERVQQVGEVEHVIEVDFFAQVGIR